MSSTNTEKFLFSQEDARLVQLVDIHGIHNWPDVANALQGRDSKSCSLRYQLAGGGKGWRAL